MMRRGWAALVVLVACCARASAAASAAIFITIVVTEIIACIVHGEILVGLCLAPPQDCLGHHNGAVDDDAEINRAERKQVG